ncbi:ankyrin repeat and SAM domain-containing protein 6-like isoform X2 [Gigantopelta aegis]|uniref:ankyrin repeat and SAM domain-containing protein 6-like isoform X2 n=1 Tax=Gigantopelta aegis TaxID=1735272 RepID=UPI001B88B023|nr:ankyrin repeat and SAM domain-containing protein 6-like isoform X2 [Gigantopelta aegis]
MERTRQLFCWCEQGDVISVQTYLESGVEVDCTDDDGNTPLGIAAANGHESVVRVLIMKGAALDKPSIFGWTPLMQASRHGHVKVVAALLQNQADVNTVTRYGVSSLMLAARGGHLHTARKLVEAGIDLNGLGRICEFTPLIAAAQHGHDAVVRFMLDRGFQVNYQTESTSLSPLMVAALNGHMTTAQILIERGGDPNLTNVNHKTALEIATICDKREVKGYLDRKTTNKPQVSPDEVKPDIIYASKHGDIQRIRELLEQDLSQRDASSPQDGATPLMFAAMAGRLDIAELLLVHGCDINKQDTISGWTALMQATYHGKKTVAMFLLNNGADVNIQAKNGCTAFDMASLIDDVDTELLRLLASKAMQVTKLDKTKKNWVKQNGSVCATLPPDFSMEDQPKSGLKAWWSRLSNRFRNLKLGRTFSMQNRLNPMPLHTSTSVQDLTLKPPKSPELQIQSARVETKKLLDPMPTALSMTSYECMMLETKKSASVYTLDINPPHSTLANETLKPVIPPFLPPPTFALDGTDQSRKMYNWQNLKSSDEDSSSTLTSNQTVGNPVKMFESRPPGNFIQEPLFVPSPHIPISRPPFMPPHPTSRLFMPRRKSSSVPAVFRNVSTTTSPNSSTSGSSSVTPQRSSHGKSASSKDSTTSTLTPSPSPTPGKTGEETGPALDCLRESTHSDEISGILKKLSLEKYHPIFEEQEVDMEAFLTLTDGDLTELGIVHNESRRQILTAITELNTGKGRERQQFHDSMATFQTTMRARVITDGSEPS